MMNKLGAAAIVAVLIGCGGSGYGNPMGPPPPPPNPNTVDATASLAFAPASITVSAGTAVSFDFGSVGHNVYFATAAGAPADITGSNANTTIMRTFTTPGTYTYTCHIHPFMHGTVVVTQ